ncbi:hypothetical protein PR048_008055 [Dryococelus australis]|uniref:DUF5641 domain-containing protein n=1 Tax=Dryococelus australis TaxID=614101 RepID=A0ABQ9HWU6_9NEOP|nr:hypothetical protein PR048_008055 [Dryococelus australis]
MEPLTAVPAVDSITVPVIHCKCWRLVECIYQRWHCEYLHTEQQRSKWWTKPAKLLQKGSLLLVWD